MITMDKYKYFRVWILFSSVVIHVHASTVKVEKVYLNWTDSNEACVLLDFLSVKPNFKTLVADMKQNEKYWIKDNVVERSVVTKGCQTKVNVLNSTTIEDNILSKCFQFCSESSDTVGIQENNCSCLSNLNNSFDNVCDDQCVWTNEQCKEIAAFSVYERKENTTSTSMVKPSASTQQHPVSGTNSQETPIQTQRMRETLNSETVYTANEPSKRRSNERQVHRVYEDTSNRLSLYNLVRARGFRGDKVFADRISISWKSSIQVYRSFNSTSILGAVVGVLVIIAILLLAIVCLFKRFRRRNSGSKYQSPSVVFSNAPRRDSKQSQEKSVKSTPVKPTRRSKKSNSNSIVQGIAYENIVLSFEDPSTISRVISSSSTVKQETKDEDTYDVMGASNTNENTTNVSQNVYGFTSSSDDYDVMDRGITRTEEQNPYYDHM
ncbi:uncharacterized protein LOC130047095 isoform X7 [Ostrea edulis]|uniref:uncharacterized protein LOC130047095 isoform X7 n=1 Tax=Ostrea edulis TaxID=37623 RepID=UPI0024AFDC5D|nr:uncharacterized protein LOC130047095 isoform X7 [Ostrea edulis]